jgi:probable phosphoglycerate mutase
VPGDAALTGRPNQLVLLRHGETDWSLTGQHTSRTDLPLTAHGRLQALGVGRRLAGRRFSMVLSSPRRRALETGHLAGFGEAAVTDEALLEWDYGEYEGRTTADIRSEVPGWSLWRDGTPGGEAIETVAARADELLGRLRLVDGDVLVISHGHFLRVLAARWIRLPATAGRHLELAPASLSTLGWEREEPVVTLWNSSATEG